METDLVGLPLQQLNANLDDDLVMRVGVPHRGGRLAYHAFEQGYPAMVSASAFWNPVTRQFQIPDMSNVYELDMALDSGGFTAMKLWQSKGAQGGIGNVFPWTFAQYVELASLLPCSWWSQPDMCCEPELASSQDEIDFRVNATATLLEGTLRYVWTWQNELAKSCAASVIANMIKPPVPVLQGWTAGDYLRSLDLMLKVWSRWEPYLAPPALIGIGSVCRRDLLDSKHGLYAILEALEGALPKGSKVHLFGVKGMAIARIKMLPWVASLDSMAYDYGARIKAHRSGVSNTMAHRSAEMTRWMETAAAQMRPAAGDQFRLSFS